MEVWTVLFSEGGWGSDLVGIYTSPDLAFAAIVQYNEREKHGTLNTGVVQEAWGTIYYCDDGSYEIQHYRLDDMPANW